MSLNVTTSYVTTAGVPERKRFPFWQETVYSPAGLDIKPTSRESFFGELAAIRVKEFSFAHLRCRGHRCSWKRFGGNGEVFVTVLLRGRNWSVQDGREAELEPGDLRFLDTTRPVEIRAMETMNDEYEALAFVIPREVWIERSGPTERIISVAIRGNTYVGGLASSFLRELFSGITTVEPKAADHLLEASLNMLNALAASISQDAPRSSGRISLLCRAKTLIEENLDDPTLSPEKIAGALKISVRYLHDLFHEDSTSMCNWMWHRRLEKCRQRLSDPLLAGRSLGDIAFGCGFSDFAHFSHKFKAAFSISPSEYRRKQLASNGHFVPSRLPISSSRVRVSSSSAP